MGDALLVLLALSSAAGSLLLLLPASVRAPSAACAFAVAVALLALPAAPPSRLSPAAAAFLRGRTVWVTGASGGIGEAITKEAAAAGARVIASARRLDELERVASEAGGSVRVLPVDLAAGDEAMQAAAKAAGDEVDVLVHNGGVGVRAAAGDTTMEVQRRVMEVNHLSAVAITHAMLPTLRKRRGAVAFIGSVQGRVGLPMRSAYAASKHAIVGYADALRAEEAAAGVSVTVVLPGHVATNLSRNALTADGTAHGALDAATAAGMPPRAVAVAALEAVAADEHELVVTNSATTRAALALRSLVPSALFRVVRWRHER